MANRHECCGNECLKCVVEWYNLGTSEDQGDDSSVPSSAVPTRVVPDSLDPSDLGTEVPDTEFDEATSAYEPNTPKSEGNGCGTGLPEVESPKSKILSDAKAWLAEKEDERRKEAETESEDSKKVNAYVKRFMERRSK